jgi:tRNA G18 (ribose-2'-O)-methylase SpoU
VNRVASGDPRLAPYVGIYGEDGRNDDLCIVEGRLTVEVLLDSPYEPVSLLIAERLVDSLGALTSAFPGDVLVASQDVINQTVGFNMHRGVVACARRGPSTPVDDVIGDNTRLLVCEAVTDPENLGALFRNAAAFGIGGMLLDPATCDPLSRRCIRVSMGHSLRVPFVRAPIRPIPGVTMIALSPAASTDIDEVRAERFALLVGNEGDGLSAEAMRAADVCARIPMAKGVDSLNVATAAAVALFALGR